MQRTAGARRRRYCAVVRAESCLLDTPCAAAAAAAPGKRRNTAAPDTLQLTEPSPAEFPPAAARGAGGRDAGAAVPDRHTEGELIRLSRATGTEADNTAL